MEPPKTLSKMALKCCMLYKSRLQIQRIQFANHLFISLILCTLFIMTVPSESTAWNCSQLKGSISAIGLWSTFLAPPEQDSFLMITLCALVLICMGNSALTCVIRFLEVVFDQHTLPSVILVIMCLQSLLTGE